MSTITKERAQQIFLGNGPEPTASEERELARIALASLEAEPVSVFKIDHESSLIKHVKKVVSETNAPPVPVSVPDEIYAELYQLREEVKGPDGFNTWRDAATAEKVLRLSMERDALRYRFLRDKDAFGDESELGLASWDDLAEMEYNEFDAAVDARMNHSDMPRYSITQGQMVENDVAASEKKASNERYKQISDIDYLGAMSAFHSDEWHKMGPITGYMHGWNACRAAMLQGADGNSPVIQDGWVMVPVALTAENGAKACLLGEFSESTSISCPECFGDDECETCDGSGTIKIKLPVSWTTIKAIWARGVEHFAAAPQQEVK